MPTKDGKMTAREFRDRKRPRKATYYKLSEKDEPIILEGLKKFVPAYVLATKIGCGYRQMSQYIKSHPHLLEVQRDAEQKRSDAMAEGPHDQAADWQNAMKDWEDYYSKQEKAD